MIPRHEAYPRIQKAQRQDDFLQDSNPHLDIASYILKCPRPLQAASRPRSFFRHIMQRDGTEAHPGQKIVLGRAPTGHTIPVDQTSPLFCAINTACVRFSAPNLWHTDLTRILIVVSGRPRMLVMSLFDSPSASFLRTSNSPSAIP